MGNYFGVFGVNFYFDHSVFFLKELKSGRVKRPECACPPCGAGGEHNGEKQLAVGGRAGRGVSRGNNVHFQRHQTRNAGEFPVVVACRHVARCQTHT